MKVHIIGGGIGGMSCALHLGILAKKGLLDDHVEIHIYEQSDRLGGKSKSQIDGLPGEHGFRFFPNFYRCIVDTLNQIEITSEYAAKNHLDPKCVKTVLKNIVDAPNSAIATDKLSLIERSGGLTGMATAIRRVFEIFDLTAAEAAKFSGLILKFLSSCEARQLQDYERHTVESFFFEKHHMSEKFRTFLASLRALSAMRATRGSVRTLMFMSTQMLVDFDDEFRANDGILPGPTDVMMLGPWQEKLEKLDVQVTTGVSLQSLRFRPEAHGKTSALAEVVLLKDGAPITIEPADKEFVVLAIPFERARPLLVESAKAGPLPPGLKRTLEIPQREDNLGEACEPMVGVQFFLRKSSGLPRGHILYCKSDWSITSIAQGQFWSETFTRPLAKQFGNEELVDIVSAIISAWDRPGSTGKAPREYLDEAELCNEALRQINAGLGPERRINPDDVFHARIDRDIKFSSEGAFCSTPLWASPAGSYTSRPAPDSGCTNFFIASDWAKTITDVGSMESADEAARWAVRAIAESSRILPSEKDLPKIKPLRVWVALEKARQLDQLLFDLGLPHPLSVPKQMHAGLLDFVGSLSVPAISELKGMNLPVPVMEELQKMKLTGPESDERLTALRGMLKQLEGLDHDPSQEPTLEQVENLTKVLSS